MGKGGSTTQTTTQDIPDYIRDQIIQTFGETENFRPNPNFIPQVAGFTAPQSDAQTLIADLVKSNPLAPANTAISNIIQDDFSVSAPLQRVLDDTMSKSINDVSSLYSLKGRLGSDAFGTAIGEGVASGVAPTLASAMEADQARKMAAIGMMPSLINQDLGLLGALNAVGTDQRALDQAKLDATASGIGAENQANQQRISNLIAALGGAPTPMTETSSKSPSNLDAITALMLGAGSIMQSDRRLKVDIKKIGTHSNGLNVYEWEWNAKAFVLGLDKYPRKGFIAQEVQEVYPEAVFEDNHGYLKIDYSKIKEVA